MQRMNYKMSNQKKNIYNVDKTIVYIDKNPYQIIENFNDDIIMDNSKIKKKEIPKITYLDILANSVIEQTTKEIIKSPQDDGSEYKLKTNWILWKHDIDNQSWLIESFDKILTITSIADFWKVFNNFHKIDYKFQHSFIMREGINPIWEDRQNRDGGICSFKVDMNASLTVWQQLTQYLVDENLVPDMDDITGISYSPKNNWVIIKIWNKNKENDLSKLIFTEILREFIDYSIKYRPNNPEF